MFKDTAKRYIEKSQKQCVYLFANAAENTFIFEESFIVGPVGNRSEKLDCIGHEQVVLAGSARVQ
jgi:hypothetical protein